MKTDLKAAVALLDQADYIAQLEALTTQANALESALAAAGKTFTARPKVDSSDLLLSVENMEQHVARLSAVAKVAGVEIAKAHAKSVVASAASQAWEPTPAKKPTATERCLAALAKPQVAQVAYKGATARCLAAKAKAVTK